MPRSQIKQPPHNYVVFVCICLFYKSTYLRSTEVLFTNVTGSARKLIKSGVKIIQYGWSSDWGHVALRHYCGVFYEYNTNAVCTCHFSIAKAAVIKSYHNHHTANARTCSTNIVKPPNGEIFVRPKGCRNIWLTICTG